MTMKSESGSVLVVVLGWVMIVSVVMIGLLAVTKEQAMLLRAHRDHQHAFYQAEQGLQCACQAIQLKQSIRCDHLQGVDVRVSTLFTKKGELHYHLWARAKQRHAVVTLEACEHHTKVGGLEMLWWRIVS